MNYLYEAIKPTRLYIKQCPHCGLKYFGKHTGQNIETYRGSGVRWNNHLNYHEIEPVHLWNSDWYYDTSIKRFALKFSLMNKIVESKQWANLKPEDGLEGGWNYVNEIYWSTFKKLEHNRTHSPFRNFTEEQRTEYSRLGALSTQSKIKLNGGIWWTPGFKGKTHTDHWRLEHSERMKIKQSGKNNSQFGTMWITDGTQNKKIKKDDQCPNGWHKGRTM